MAQRTGKRGRRLRALCMGAAAVLLFSLTPQAGTGVYAADSYTIKDWKYEATGFTGKQIEGDIKASELVSAVKSTASTAVYFTGRSKLYMDKNITLLDVSVARDASLEIYGTKTLTIQSQDDRNGKRTGGYLGGLSGHNRSDGRDVSDSVSITEKASVKAKNLTGASITIDTTGNVEIYSEQLAADAEISANRFVMKNGRLTVKSSGTGVEERDGLYAKIVDIGGGRVDMYTANPCIFGQVVSIYGSTTRVSAESTENTAIFTENIFDDTGVAAIRISSPLGFIAPATGSVTQVSDSGTEYEMYAVTAADAVYPSDAAYTVRGEKSVTISKVDGAVEGNTIKDFSGKSTGTYKVSTSTTLLREVAFKKMNGESSALVIPAKITSKNGAVYTVTGILSEACAGNTSLKSVSLPVNVETIGKAAFENCSRLSEIELYATYLKNIKKGCFKGIADGATFTIHAGTKKEAQELMDQINGAGGAGDGQLKFIKIE